ncbi:outer membrane beta-barrel protein [Chitinophaga caeni]|uniref:outer membrane beta-barrel protein n=1 Tax=Chitinophaga caeni TaxID=2029983 RepID=UPI0018E0AA48|nr:outer membrane beta-barrel protein [Chitinophaga caeni]
MKTQILAHDKKTPMAYQRFGVFNDKTGDMMLQGMTDSLGNIIMGLNPGNYWLKMNAMGYHNLELPFSIGEGSFAALPAKITLQENKAVQLKEVTVRDNTPPVSMKGDTIEYNASRFKTKDGAVVEELLRKLPGVQVDRDGSIKAQGETVQRILVDGKEFFGSDPAIASKNLPADMIDKVQVLDKQSEMAEFTGIKDGQETKTINLVTKKNSKRGIFGNAHAGFGNRDRYDAGFNINSLVDDMQLSALLKGNNVNKSGFSSAELIRMASSNPDMLNNLPPAALSDLMHMKGVSISGSAEALSEIARPVGMTDVLFGGLNFNNDWKNLSWRSDYFFNQSKNTNQFEYNKLVQLVDTSYQYLQQGNQVQDMINHRIGISADWKINPRSSIKFNPNFYINRNSSSQNRDFSSLGLKGDLLNEGTANLHATSRQVTGAMDILLRHRFKRPGNTLMINVKPEIYAFRQNQSNHSSTKFYNVKNEEQVDINQLSDNESRQFHTNINGIYTMPVSRHLFLQAGQRLYLGSARYDTRIKDDQYPNLNPDLSDLLETDQWQSQSKLALAGNWDRFNFTANAGFIRNELKGSSQWQDYTIDQKFSAFAPEIISEYKWTQTSRLKFQYNYNTSLPSIQNLQGLVDKSDPLYIRMGNPDLSPLRKHNITAGFRKFDIKNGKNFYLNAKAQYEDVAVTDSVGIDLNSGAQVIKPVNISGNYNISLSSGQSFRLKNNGSYLNTSLSIGYGKQSIYNNNILSTSRSLNIDPQIDANYYIGSHTSLYGKFRATWNQRSLRIPGLEDQSNWLLNYSLESIHILPLNFTCESSIEFYQTLGMSENYNQTISILNLALQKGFGKSWSLRLEAKDLLNKNAGINSIVGNGYIEERSNTALGRFFLLSAQYKFRKFKKIK